MKATLNTKTKIPDQDVLTNQLNYRPVLASLLYCLLLAGCSTDQATGKNKLTPAVQITSGSTISATNQLATAEVTNANAFALDREPLYFSLYDIGVAATDPRIKNLALLLDNKPIASQLVDSDGDSTVDSVLALVDFAPAQIRQLRIVSDAAIVTPKIQKQTQAEISIKEGGEWRGSEYVGGKFKNVTQLTPPPQYTDHSFYLRYEGPGLESDQVGYRIYLDWRNEFDIFGKKTRDVVLQNVGQDGYDSYHAPAAWGQDILKVGDSLGIGAFGFWNGTSVDLLSRVDSRNVTITNNGDLYSGFKIDYNGWQLRDRKLDIAAHFSITGGSRLVNVKLRAKQKSPNIAIGLVKHPNTKLIEGNREVSGQAWTYSASWGKQSLSGVNDHLGMAVIFRRSDLQQQTQDKNSYVTVLNDNGGEVDYYFLAAWEHELEGIKTEKEFIAYLDREVARLTKAPRVRFESTYSANAKKTLDAAAALAWGQRLGDSELARKTLNYHYGGWDEYRQRPAKFEYDVVGMQIHALQEINAFSPKPAYEQALETVTASYIREDGHIYTFEPDLFSIDLTKPGQMVILLEQQTKEEKYRKAVDYLRARLKVHPRTSEGAFWHRATYPNQLWLDGVYMGIPFLAQYAATYETGAAQHESFKEAVHEFVLARKYLRNPETGLYYHAWDESKKALWANKTNGLAPQYWSRGMGWYAMALVDVLDFLPESESQLRKVLIDNIAELASDILRYQDPQTGTWWQITDRPGDIGNYRESSASAMFTYFLAKAVNKGYLPESYRAAAITSYRGLINEFVTLHTDGRISMNDQCLVAGLGFGRDGSYDYYMTEPIVSNDAKGNAPFIFASVEIHKLLK